MKYPTLCEAKTQIENAIALYVDKFPEGAKESAAQGMLSGMSLMANFLYKCDGSGVITAHAMLDIVICVGREKFGEGQPLVKGPECSSSDGADTNSQKPNGT